MANAVIQYLRLDSENDPIFDPIASLTDIDAVAQAIETTLLFFQGEWWENLNEGTPMFQSILGASGSPASQNAMNLAITDRVRSVPYVQNAENVVSGFDPKTREFSMSLTAITAFGTTPVLDITPGAAASIGGTD